MTGEGISETEEFCDQNNVSGSKPSEMLSLFLLSSTNCGSNNGFNLGDIVVGGVVKGDEEVA